MKSTIKLSFIKSFPSVEEGIFNICNISKSKLKTFKFSKNFLAKKILIKDEIELPIDLINLGKINPNYTGENIEKIFEDENFFVFSKPHKTHSHPLSYSDSNNTLSALYTISGDLLNVNKESYDRGLLYRLDFETSGLMYFAKTTSIYQDMRENFSSMIKEKNYYAIVEGKIESKKLTHNLKTSGKKGSIVKEDSLGRKCTIDVEALEYSEIHNQSLVKVNLQEGFKHQIRAQLMLDNHPIVGDEIYGAKNSTRLWLHCFEYKFDYREKSYSCSDETEKLKAFFNNFNSKL